ncbi:MAG TPA: molybdopterin-dependent oxidoreductase [Gaiellales bacterium]|nr:molybdopterin-dependent oxidoreductase [Gaiellales bacterium]
MARRTNLTLLAALSAALVSGVLSLWVGEGRAWLVTWLHGAAGFWVVLLIRWKLPVARRGLARRGSDAGASLVAAAVAIGMLVTGIAHALGAGDAGPVTVLGLHVALGVALVPLVLMHVVSHPQRPRRGDLTRAAFLRVAGVAVAAVAVKAVFEGTVGSSRAATGSLRQGQPAPTSWLNDSTPPVDSGEWQQRMAGLPRRSVTCALDCTSGWYSVNRWTGVGVDDLLGRVPSGTRSVIVRSHTGYSRRFDIGEVPGLLLATELDGSPLAPAHGAPARLVAPGRRGFWWVKWVSSIEPSSLPSWWQLPFPIG